MSTAPALPPVTGQHRNRALAAARRTRAVELATAGLTYQAIADRLGYASRGTVWRLVHEALRRDQDAAAENLRQLETERLDALQAALWDEALGGDLAAAHQVVEIIRARARLLGLDLRRGQMSQRAPAPKTVVVTEQEGKAGGRE